MGDLESIKQMMIECHEEKEDNTKLIQFYIRKLKEVESNICTKLKLEGEVPSNKLDEAYREVNKEVFKGIEDIVIKYKEN